MPDKNKGERIYFGSQFEGRVHHCGQVMVEKHETTGHIVFTIRKQREMNAGGQLICPFFSTRTPAHRLMLPTFRVNLPSVKLLETPSKIHAEVCFHSDSKSSWQLRLTWTASFQVVVATVIYPSFEGYSFIWRAYFGIPKTLLSLLTLHAVLPPLIMR